MKENNLEKTINAEIPEKKEDPHTIYCDWNDKIHSCAFYGTIYCTLRCSYAMSGGENK